MKGEFMKRSLIILPALLLAACQTTPSKYAATLPETDPKFNSPECKAMRQKALTYDDKIGGRVAIGLGAGLLLGPFGIPIAAAADANQNQIRKDWNREMHLACSSKPLPDNLKEDKSKPQGNG